MLKNFVRSVCVDKPSLEASLEEQTLTPNNLEKKIPILEIE
jgi:hypothetical protein